MDFQEIAAKFLALQLFVLLLGLTVSIGSFALFITALMSCLKHTNDKDRLTWVLVIIFVPLIGPILYFTMANRDKATGLPPPRFAVAPQVLHHAEPAFDHSAIHEEKSRAASINESLRKMGKSQR